MTAIKSADLAKLVTLLNKLVANTASQSQSKSTVQATLPFKRSIDGGLTERQIKNDSAVIRAFKKLGISVKPRIDVMTYNMWLKQGRKVRPGQKAKAFVKGVGNLFTLDQTDTFHETKAELRQIGEAAVSNTLLAIASRAALDAEYGPTL
jgi:hypothetical protein